MPGTGWVVAATCLLTACLAPSTPAPEYRLTPQQLAWQPYQLGQVLRFGNGSTATVRTYVVSRLSDKTEAAYCSFCLVEQQPKYQSIQVSLARTDTSSTDFEVLDMYLYPDKSSGSSSPVFHASTGWLYYHSPALPIEELNSAMAFDTLQYQRVNLLSGYALGPTSYAQLLRVRYAAGGQVSAGVRAIRNLYLTREKGVVGFEEKASGLWYRLP